MLRMAEELIPRLRVADWLDRADAAQRQMEHLDLRDLRSVVAASDDPAVARDESTRELATTLKAALVTKQDEELTLWLADVEVALDVGRVVRALRLSSVPPKAGVPFPGGAGHAGWPRPPRRRCSRATAPTAGRPCSRRRRSRRSASLVTPAAAPEQRSDELVATVRRLGPLLPQVAALFEIEVPAGAAVPKPLRPTTRRPEAKKAAPKAAPRPPAPRTADPAAAQPGRARRAGRRRRRDDRRRRRRRPARLSRRGGRPPTPPTTPPPPTSPPTRRDDPSRRRRDVEPHRRRPSRRRRDADEPAGRRRSRSSADRPPRPSPPIARPREPVETAAADARQPPRRDRRARRRARRPTPPTSSRTDARRVRRRVDADARADDGRQASPATTPDEADPADGLDDRASTGGQVTG